ncbi:MAG: M48 family metallopeptidase [Pseudomonadota bacterium]
MELVYKNEKTLFSVMLGVSLSVWIGLIIGTFGAALVYLLCIAIFYCFAQSALVSYLKGTAVKITYQQFPDLKARIDACCERLGLAQVPDAYLLQMGGMFHAFATRFLGNHFIVLYSDVVDALEDKPDAINFYIGHEIGHIKRQHLRWSPLFMPASVLPLLGAAYSRAREYTCDRHGFHACDDLNSAQFGLAALAAGGKRWRQLSVSNYASQAQEASGFWMSFHELVGDTPWLVKRMVVMRDLAHGVEAEALPRSRLAYLLALCVPRLGVAGGVGGLFALAALAAALAMLALPAYQRQAQRGQMARAVNVGMDATAAVERYYYVNGRSPASLREAGFALTDPDHVVVDVRVDGENGVVRVFPADFSYRGKAIAFTPRLDGNKKVAWRCAGEDIPAHLLPAACQGN